MAEQPRNSSYSFRGTRHSVLIPTLNLNFRPSTIALSKQEGKKGNGKLSHSATVKQRSKKQSGKSPEAVNTPESHRSLKSGLLKSKGSLKDSLISKLEVNGLPTEGLVEKQDSDREWNMYRRVSLFANTFNSKFFGNNLAQKSRPSSQKAANLNAMKNNRD